MTATRCSCSGAIGSCRIAGGGAAQRYGGPDEKPADAAIRELEEETGYRAENVEHLITLQALPGIAGTGQAAA
jgi:NUDIX domain